ncbi:MAG: CRISPR-associated endonuclease Cas2 [Actinomycetota bacterium]
MPRRRYVVAYDIRDEVRLRRVHKAMKGFGYPLQFSVFVCDLDTGERLDLKREVGEIMNQREDSVVLIDLGDPDVRGTECFDFLGPSRGLPQRGPQIV